MEPQSRFASCGVENIVPLPSSASLPRLLYMASGPLAVSGGTKYKAFRNCYFKAHRLLYVFIPPALTLKPLHSANTVCLYVLYCSHNKQSFPPVGINRLLLQRSRNVLSERLKIAPGQISVFRAWTRESTQLVFRQAKDNSVLPCAFLHALCPPRQTCSRMKMVYTCTPYWSRDVFIDGKPAGPPRVVYGHNDTSSKQSSIMLALWIR
jgi:hypothetical protein